MKRRGLLSALAVSSLGGCLRIVEPDGGASAQTAAGEATSQGGESTPGGGTDEFFASETEALEYASGFAIDEAVVVEQSVDRTPVLLEHGGGSGSSSSSGDDGGLYTSQDIHFTSIPTDGVVFGGGTGRSLRVRNHTLGKAAVFEPYAETGQYRVENWSIDAEAEGVPPSAIELETVDSQEQVMLDGQWRGDTDLFRTQAFGEYVIELVEDSTRIGTTDGAVYGIRYHVGAKQTREALYVTRQPSTNESWDVALYAGESYFDPVATQAATHVVEDDVFRVDLTELDLEPGRYGYWVFVGEGGQLERNHFISLSPGSGELLIP